MRKLLLRVTILAALVVVFLTMTAAAASEIGTGVVHADALRLRREPNTSSKTLAYFLDGTRLTIHEKLDGWYKISWKDLTGYVSSDYVSFTPAAAPKALKAAEPQGTVALINSSEVSFFTGAAEDSELIGTLPQGMEVNLLSHDDEWCKVRLNGIDGYIRSEFVSVNGVALAHPRGIVTGSCVNVRSQPSTAGKVLTQVYAGTLIDLIELNNGWYSMEYNGVQGYICADYVREYSSSTSSKIGDDVVALALSYVGTPYVYGGASPKGFDCSGFTMYVFSQFGYSLSHSATSQWNNSGEYVEKEELQPGDLVFFCDPNSSRGKACSHVGIYIGDGEFVHAASGSSGRRIRISSLSEDYYDRYYKGAKRIG